MLLEDRIVKFAAQCVKTCAMLPVKSVGSASFADQMFRSATSVAANYAEACEAESSKDFVHKLKIAMKELSILILSYYLQFFNTIYSWSNTLVEKRQSF